MHCSNDKINCFEYTDYKNNFNITHNYKQQLIYDSLSNILFTENTNILIKDKLLIKTYDYN